ncbi:MAG: PQQ-dependent sugar dehydrogenase [Geodermatophilaceae bacterium]|nr:PQQ-dependent sugar dehydrogenase [Geodermatophilaceae bacterium]
MRPLPRPRPTRRVRPLAAAVVAALALVGCGNGETGEVAPPSTATSSTPPPSTSPPPSASGDGGTSVDGPIPSFGAPTSVATDIRVPWGLAFLPDGSALVAERPTGRILQVTADGTQTEVMTVPDVADMGEGGLLGLAISPDYATDGLVYAYYTTEDDNRIVRFTLGGEPEVLLDGLVNNDIHNGGRIAFGPDGMLYAGVGDAGDTGNAQDPDSLNGKILRLDPDGGVPADNPDPDSPVWSLGHRNVQGLAWDASGAMYGVEFGQSTFDEVNLIQPGNNYGWPDVEGDGDTDGGRYTNPLVTWSTDEASPSGAAVAGDTLYVAGLGGQRLWTIPVTGPGALGEPVAVLEGTFGRLRTVAVGTDGALWLTTSNTSRGEPRDGDDHVYRFPTV